VSSAEEYTLYRVDWEEPSLENEGEWLDAFAYVPSRESINPEGWGMESRNVRIREASEVEQEAYNNGFEDGFDVATVKYRLQDMNMEDAIPLNLARDDGDI
jgi:hypothetical protein